MALNDLAPDALLHSRARRAYELGRLRTALRVAPFVLLALAAALLCGRPLDVCSALCAVLLPLSVGLVFLGGSAGRAVRPGLLAGFAALALPLLVRTAGHACMGPACMILCLPSCVLGGALAGGVPVLTLARRAQ